MNNQHPETGYTHVMYALHAFAGVWILYRVVRGWLALREGKAMHV